MMSTYCHQRMRTAPIAALSLWLCACSGAGPAVIVDRTTLDAGGDSEPGDDAPSTPTDATPDVRDASPVVDEGTPQECVGQCENDYESCIANAVSTCQTKCADEDAAGDQLCLDECASTTNQTCARVEAICICCEPSMGGACGLADGGGGGSVCLNGVTCP